MRRITSGGDVALLVKKQFTAVVLLSWLLGALLLPLTGSAYTAAPACCRVHGEHHCEQAADSSPGASVVASCNYRRGTPIVTSAVVVGTAAVLACGGEVWQLPATVAHSICDTQLRPATQRGPPAFFALS